MKIIILLILFSALNLAAQDRLVMLSNGSSYGVMSGDEYGMEYYMAYSTIIGKTESEDDGIINGFIWAQAQEPDGVEDLSTVNVIDAKIYPNPVIDNAELHIKIPEGAEAEVDIIDLFGKSVRDATKPLPERKGAVCKLNTSNLVAGTYFCRIKYKDKFLIVPFVKI